MRLQQVGPVFIRAILPHPHFRPTRYQWNRFGERWGIRENATHHPIGRSIRIVVPYWSLRYWSPAMTQLCAGGFPVTDELNASGRLLGNRCGDRNLPPVRALSPVFDRHRRPGRWLDSFITRRPRNGRFSTSSSVPFPIGKLQELVHLSTPSPELFPREILKIRIWKGRMSPIIRLETKVSASSNMLKKY